MAKKKNQTGDKPASRAKYDHGKGAAYCAPSSLMAGYIDRPNQNPEAVPPGTPAPDPNPPNNPPVPTTITLSPLSAAVVVGQTVQLSATVLDQFGSDMGLVPSWTTSDATKATVSQTGLVTGIAAGSANLTAYYGGVVSSASTSVQISNAAITTVVVAPSSLSMQVGGATTTLTATTKDAQGNTWLNRTVTWTNSTPGVCSISPTTGYSVVATAVAAGTPGIFATCETINSNTVAGTVAAAPSGGGTTPNRPATVTVFQTDHSFSNGKTADGWSDRGDANFSLVASGYQGTPPLLTAPNTTVGQARFQAGTWGGTGPIYTDYTYSATPDEIYWRIGFQCSSNWVGNNSNVNKIFWAFTKKPGASATNPIIWTMYGHDLANLSFSIQTQGCPPSLGGNTTSGDGHFGAFSITRGTWYDIEGYCKLNTSGVADGISKIWRNGTLVQNKTDLCVRGPTALYCKDNTHKFTNWLWNPTYGGGAYTHPEQFMWMDRVIVYTN